MAGLAGPPPDAYGGAPRGTDALNDFWHLHNFDWLNELSPEEAEALRARSASAAYATGDLVFGPTQAPQSVYLLESGLVRIYRTSDAGDETTFGYVNPGEIFGELAAFDECARESWAQAAKPSVVWRVTRDAMRAVLQRHPGIVVQVTKQIGSRLKRVETRVEDLVFRDVRSRLSRVLIQLADDFGRPVAEGRLIDLDVTQEELATLVGATRQTVNATLRDMEREALLGRQGRLFVVRDVDALRATLAPAPS